MSVPLRGPRFLLRRVWVPTLGIIAPPVKFKCPNCETEIYNRAQKTCRACGFELPAELLLSDAQIRHFEESVERDRKTNCAADVAMPDIPPDAS
jgi:ribosomal protein L37E